MADIININIGQAGIRIADHFWQTLRNQHKIGEAENQGSMGFFEEKSQGWEARSIFIDRGSRDIDILRNKRNSLYNPHDFVTTNIPSRGIYPEGHYTSYPEIAEEIQGLVRKKAENCDNLGGFLIFSSLGGGTSSGVGMRTLRYIREQYPDRMIQTVKLLPNLNDITPLEVYNTAYSIKEQVLNTDMTMLFDNSSVLRVMTKEQYYRPTIDQQNKWVAESIAELTIPYRFSGSLNTNQRKIGVNLVLFPRVHFFPFSLSSQHGINPLAGALKPQNLSLSNYYGGGGKIFSIYAGVHDNFTNEQEIFSTITTQYSRQDLHFVDWFENNVHMSLHAPVSQPSASLIVNSQNMQAYFKKLSQLYAGIFRKRGFLHAYTGVGLDMMEFVEMECNINDLTSEYTSYGNSEDNDDNEEESNVSEQAQ